MSVWNLEAMEALGAVSVRREDASKKHLHLSRGNIFVSLKNFSFANPAVVLHALGFKPQVNGKCR